MSAENTPPAFATSREMADAARSAWCSVVIEVVPAEVKMLQGGLLLLDLGSAGNAVWSLIRFSPRAREAVPC